MSAPGPELAASLRQPLLPVHIAVALAGLAVFGVATAVAGVYLAVERMLKGKRFGPFFRRVPSLELLDDLNRRLVAWGFIALSLTLLPAPGSRRGSGPTRAGAPRSWRWWWPGWPSGWCSAAHRRGLAWPAGGAAHHGRIRRPGRFLRQPCDRAVGDPVSLPLVCVGLSHQHRAAGRARAAGAARGPADRAAPARSPRLRSRRCCISTCNRVELYVVAPAGTTSQERTRSRRGSRGRRRPGHAPLRATTARPRCVHLFRVAASLDSMVLGEPQILGQVKDAFEQAQRLGAARGELARICAAAFGSAKRVRTETELGRAATSMASAAVEMARHIFDGLDGKTVLLIGRGRDGRAGRQAPPRGRRVPGPGGQPDPRAGRGAGGEPRRHRRCPSTGWRRASVLADVVVCTTASPAPVFTREKVARVLQAPEAPAAVPGGPRGAAGRRPRTCTRWTASTPTTWTTSRRSSTRTRRRAPPRRPRPRWWWPRRSPATSASARSATGAGAGAAPCAGRADPPRRAGAAPWPTSARRSRRQQEKSIEAMASAIVNKLLHEPTARLRAVARRRTASWPTPPPSCSGSDEHAPQWGGPPVAGEGVMLRIATRKSPLALWQARHVAGLLRARSPGTEVTLVELSTEGDRLLDSAAVAHRRQGPVREGDRGRRCSTGGRTSPCTA